ncbi:MAG: arginine--tRNA ligase, partial [Candidatus Micrarchaeia archaeon]
MLKEIEKKIASEIKAYCERRKIEIEEKEIYNSFSIPKEEFGDFSTSIAFHISKKVKKSPQEIAEEIMKEIAKTIKIKEIKKVEAKGGYINFFFSDSFYLNLIEKVDENFGRGEKKNFKIIVEYPSVNPNKPWHVGHLRNALIGDCISNILEFSGYEVERYNYINDLGLQVAQSVWGYITSEEKETEEKFDHYLGKKYVEIAKKEVSDEIKNFLKKLEKGEETVGKRAREICEKCLDAQLKTSFDYNIFYDLLIWESDILRSNIFQKAHDLLIKNKLMKKVEDENSPFYNCYTVDLDTSLFPSMKSEEK